MAENELNVYSLSVLARKRSINASLYIIRGIIEFQCCITAYRSDEEDYVWWSYASDDERYNYKFVNDNLRRHPLEYFLENVRN